MKLQNLAIATVLALIAPVQGISVQPAFAEADRVQLTGTVSYAGSAVSGAAIQLSGPGGFASTSTDNSGRYSFWVLPGSGYGLTVEWNSPSLAMTKSVDSFLKELT